MLKAGVRGGQDVEAIARLARRIFFLAMPVGIDGEGLPLEQVVRVARFSEPVALSEAAIERMRLSRLKVERVLARDDAVYGMTTGLGQHKRYRLATGDGPAFTCRPRAGHLCG